MTNTDDDLSDMQQRFLAALPATTNELASELGVKPTTIRYHRDELDDKGVRLLKDNRTGRWTLAGHQEFAINWTVGTWLIATAFFRSLSDKRS